MLNVWFELLYILFATLSTIMQVCFVCETSIFKVVCNSTVCLINGVVLQYKVAVEYKYLNIVLKYAVQYWNKCI